MISNTPVYFVYGNSKAIANIVKPDPKYFGFERVGNHEFWMLWRRLDKNQSSSDIASLHNEAARYRTEKTEVVSQLKYWYDYPEVAVDGHSNYINFNIGHKDGFRRLKFETLKDVQCTIQYEHAISGTPHQMPVTDIFIVGETNNNRKLERMFLRAVGKKGVLDHLYLDEVRRRLGNRNNVYIRNMKGYLINLKTMEIVENYGFLQGEQDCLIWDRKVIMTAVTCKVPRSMSRLDNICTVSN